ncbi:Chalcone isomerase [Dillenia turbinata]|uniref:Chalcone-flavonone isomerase family protein n=1 Tax=Dillenia turbinata TaxID=194707 RepID=A0AAN8ZR46_9MAGN
MVGAAQIWFPNPIISPSKDGISRPRMCFCGESANPTILFRTSSLSFLSTLHLNFSPQNSRKLVTATYFSARASSSSSVEQAEYIEEAGTKVKFQKWINLPGLSSSLTLLGTGYREKVFAIIGVKVYAAGFYVNPSLANSLIDWKGRSAVEMEKDALFFKPIFEAPVEKSIQIVLVRDIDGKTFWDALNEAISTNLKNPTPVDESALSTFRSIFQDRPLKKGTNVVLTWVNQHKMLVSVSSDGLPTSVEATIESNKVNRALFIVYFGGKPISPALKGSVSKGLATILYILTTSAMVGLSDGSEQDCNNDLRYDEGNNAYRDVEYQGLRIFHLRPLSES